MSLQLPMPNLQRLRCPPKFLPSITTAGLKEIRLIWFISDSVGTTFVKELKSLTRSDISFVCSLDCTEDRCKEILDSLSSNIPYTQTLQMSIFSFSSRDDIMTHLMECLPRFTNLLFLSIPGHPGHFAHIAPEYRIMAQDFFNTCSTLQACRLHDEAWRKVNGTWEPFPVEDFCMLAGISWV
ncbi:hypothetical protein MVEN_00739900 [Mycena venus]|uniref:Uncharacterized protein n=1 Tax=Mycena venus TaxID=2733690 RepID=A0A8H7D3H2_9AGAR|nr:hypothetical protein MVEN_00739900 [Mycena venus]